MCGIAGSVRWDRPDSKKLIESLTDTLTHRGPDAGMVKQLGAAVLGHRRLSIIDLQPSSNQPMADHTERYWIVFNGEIYNYQEVKQQLSSLGARFRTKSDTEVILEAYKQWGVDCLNHLVGMFAFALWDQDKQQLLLARDRMGEKPLFYAEIPGKGLVFASELKALQDYPDIAWGVNTAALSDFLSLNYILTDNCIIQGVKKLPPAHFILLQKDKPIEPKLYWDLAYYFKEKSSWQSEEEAGEALTSLLQLSVSQQSISDVPLGAFLSGGIDSSTIVASMTRQTSSQQIKTFSSGFKEKSYNELPQAALMAGFLNVDHHAQYITADIAHALPKILYHADEPFADTSIIPTYFLAAFARQQVTVSLSGDGGDELFAGYETYSADKLYGYMRYMPKTILRLANKAIEAVVPVSLNKVSFDYKLRHFLRGCQLPFEQAHYSWRLINTEEEKRLLLEPDLFHHPAYQDPFEMYKQHFTPLYGCHPLDQALYVDMKTWLVDDVLVKVDRASMAHSLEVRAPFLDHRLVEFAASLSPEWKLKGWQKKYLLKKSQEKLLPKEIINRPKKGFNAPISTWLLKDLYEMARDLTASALPHSINRARVNALWQEHLRGQKDHGLRLFGLLCLALWYKNYKTISR